MTEQTDPMANNQAFVEVYQAAYEKSVIAMVDDIISEYRKRLESGAKKFMYYKNWPSDGYFMSPVYTEGKKMESKNNTILQDEKDITKFKIDVYKRIINLYGIFIHSLEVKYVDNKYGWHHMKFEIVLSLDAPNSD